jgi:hypothetical protein
MPAARIAEVVFSDADAAREVIHNFNSDGFEALHPRYSGGWPRTFTLPQRQAIKRIALAVLTDLGQPFATWSLAKLGEYLVAEEVVAAFSDLGVQPVVVGGLSVAYRSGSTFPTETSMSSASTSGHRRTVRTAWARAGRAGMDLAWVRGGRLRLQAMSSGLTIREAIGVLEEVQRRRKMEVLRGGRERGRRAAVIPD